MPLDDQLGPTLILSETGAPAATAEALGASVAAVAVFFGSVDNERSRTELPQATEALAALSPDVRVVYCPTEGDEESAARAVAGVPGVLSLPFGGEGVRLARRACLAFPVAVQVPSMVILSAADGSVRVPDGLEALATGRLAGVPPAAWRTSALLLRVCEGLDDATVAALEDSVLAAGAFSRDPVELRCARPGARFHATLETADVGLQLQRGELGVSPLCAANLGNAADGDTVFVQVVEVGDAAELALGVMDAGSGVDLAAAEAAAREYFGLAGGDDDAATAAALADALGPGAEPSEWMARFVARQACRNLIVVRGQRFAAGGFEFEVRRPEDASVVSPETGLSVDW